MTAEFFQNRVTAILGVQNANITVKIDTFSCEIGTKSVKIIKRSGEITTRDDDFV